jgi:hypothetical protein
VGPRSRVWADVTGMSHSHDDNHVHPHTHEGDKITHDHDAGHGHEHGPDTHTHEKSHGHASTALSREETARRDLRRGWAALSEEAVAGEHNELWTQRRALTERLVALTEEMIARAVRESIADAGYIVLYEDHSHDAPHAHVLHVLDADGHVIVSGTGDDWHDAVWTTDVDELVWDLFHLDRHGFITRPEEGHTMRVRRIPVL